MQPSPAATRLVRDWARAALRSEGGHGPGPVERTSLPTDDVLAAIRRQRLIDLLAMNADSIDLPGEVSGPLAGLRTGARRALMVQVLELARVGSLFDEAGVPWLSIKGPALAVQTTGDLSARGSGDLDVFVHPSSVESVYHLLNDRGWIVRPVGSGEPDSWAWHHILSSFNEMTFDGRSSTIDLHWRLDPTHSALPDFEDSWARRTSIDVADISVETLGLGDAFSHTCHHAMKDDWRWLRSLVDIHRLARRSEVCDARPLNRIDETALAVTDACVGLPEGVHPTVRDQGGRAVHRAIAAQGRPTVAAFPFPAAQSFRDARYRVRASHQPADLGRTAIALVIPAKAVADLPDHSARTAIPRVLARRVGWLVRRVVAWIRREPGASVVQPSSRSR